MNYKEFHDKFEVHDTSGAYLMHSAGCFSRHDQTRDEQALTVKETSVRSFDYYRSEDARESTLISCVSQLQSKGVPITESSLELYVLKHVDMLDVKDEYIESLCDSIYN